jgi:hypothetical protein
VQVRIVADPRFQAIGVVNNLVPGGPASPEGVEGLIRAGGIGIVAWKKFVVEVGLPALFVLKLIGDPAVDAKGAKGSVEFVAELVGPFDAVLPMVGEVLGDASAEGIDFTLAWVSDGLQKVVLVDEVAVELGLGQRLVGEVDDNALLVLLEPDLGTPVLLLLVWLVIVSVAV